MPEFKSLREAYGNALVELASLNPDIVAMDADLSSATKSNVFKQSFPDRFFNFGIAENNMICSAAGFAYSGFIPYVSTFAIFGAARSFEMIRSSVCYVNANVKFVFTHAGISVGEDGGSHQCIEDLALMRVLPNMTVFTPCDAYEVKKAVFAAAQIDGPVYIRIPRPASTVLTNEKTKFIPGKANLIKDGADVCIIASGLMVKEALDAARLLKGADISAAVVNMHTIKPLDVQTILKMASKCSAIVTVEDHSIIGGLGSAVAEVLAENSTSKFLRIGIMDTFGQSGNVDSLLKEYGLDSRSIYQKIRDLIL